MEEVQMPLSAWSLNLMLLEAKELFYFLISNTKKSQTLPSGRRQRVTQESQIPWYFFNL
jgi:hypothetical protein